MSGCVSLFWSMVFGGLLSCAETEEKPQDSAPIEDPVSTEPPSSFEVTGTVVDSDGTPVVDAMVLVGGREDTLVYTDAQGYFSLWYTNIYFGELNFPIIESR